MDTEEFNQLVEDAAIEYMDDNRHADYLEAREYAIKKVVYWHIG